MKNHNKKKEKTATIKEGIKPLQQPSTEGRVVEVSLNEQKARVEG
jgi:hypothetical protein